ncbi:unannotated protein [freshwater metagenome]|uniref:Unannotated protein n=1 Tax=freshwater metagenome TaxID=449393 RepID=A0A6J6XDZ1_9ZZZZ
MPVLPPTAASTIPARVVGTAIQSIPRNHVLAAKPAISVVAPPPTAITKSERVNPARANEFHKDSKVVKDLPSSPSGTSIIVMRESLGTCFRTC